MLPLLYSRHDALFRKIPRVVKLIRYNGVTALWKNSTQPFNWALCNVCNPMVRRVRLFIHNVTIYTHSGVTWKAAETDVRMTSDIQGRRRWSRDKTTGATGDTHVTDLSAVTEIISFSHRQSTPLTSHAGDVDDGHRFHSGVPVGGAGFRRRRIIPQCRWWTSAAFFFVPFSVAVWHERPAKWMGRHGERERER